MDNGAAACHDGIAVAVTQAVPMPIDSRLQQALDQPQPLEALHAAVREMQAALRKPTFLRTWNGRGLISAPPP
jgi:hypothetical protein